MPKKNTQKTTICLNMIVRNEAHILKRCLESVIPYIDTWVISDTGSTDGTQGLIREAMKNIPGELIERKWQDFGHNRHEVLQHSKAKADYILTIDADEWLTCDEGFDFGALTADSYYIMKSMPDKKYWVRNIVKNNLGWKWQGVLHEHLSCAKAESYEDLHGAIINVTQEGARAHNPETYKKDIALLTRALVDEPNNARYQFYLAQSLYNAEDYKAAITHYNNRIKMGGWEEEVFYSKYQIARSMVSLGKDWSECLTAFLEAWQYTPKRAEPLYNIGIYYTNQKNWPLAWLFLNQAARLKQPEDLILFIEEQVYQYEATFGASVAAGHLGYMDEMERLHEELLNRKDLPQVVIETAKNNFAYFTGMTSGEEVL